MPDPKIVRCPHDLRFNAPLAAVEQLGAKEPMVRVELEEQLAGRALRRGLRGRESDAHGRDPG
jgi:hypothetical protein